MTTWRSVVTFPKNRKCRRRLRISRRHVETSPTSSMLLESTSRLCVCVCARMVYLRQRQTSMLMLCNVCVSACVQGQSATAGQARGHGVCPPHQPAGQHVDQQSGAQEHAEGSGGRHRQHRYTAIQQPSGLEVALSCMLCSRSCPPATPAS